MYIFCSSDSYIYMYTAAAAKSLQLRLCDPIGGPPGSPVPGVLQARTLQWVAISFFNICICIYLKLSQFAEHQKLRQHCELTVLQLKKKKKTGKKWRKKMLNSASHHRNTNQNHNEAPPNPSQNIHHQKKIYK